MIFARFDVDSWNKKEIFLEIYKKKQNFNTKSWFENQ